MGWALFLFDAVFLVRNCANPPAAFTCQLRIRCIPQDATPAEVHPLYRGIFNVNCKPLLPLVYQGWWDYGGLKQGGSSLVSPPVVIRWSGSPQMPTFDAAGRHRWWESPDACTFNAAERTYTVVLVSGGWWDQGCVTLPIHYAKRQQALNVNVV